MLGGLANGHDCKTLFVPGFMFDLQTFIFCFVQMLGLDAGHIYSFDWMTLCLRENVFKLGLNNSLLRTCSL